MPLVRYVFDAKSGEIGAFSQDGNLEDGRAAIKRMAEKLRDVGIEFEGGDTPETIADRVEQHRHDGTDHVHHTHHNHAEGHQH